MSLWICPNCKSLTHCSVGNICPKCGGPCEIAKFVKDDFDSLKFVEKVNKDLEDRQLKLPTNDIEQFSRTVTSLLADYLTKFIGTDYRLDEDGTWVKYAKQTVLIVTFTLYLKNKYYFSLVYLPEKSSAKLFPFHMDQYLEQYLNWFSKEN